jgi:hypothetical protein
MYLIQHCSYKQNSPMYLIQHRSYKQNSFPIFDIVNMTSLSKTIGQSPCPRCNFSDLTAQRANIRRGGTRTKALCSYPRSSHNEAFAPPHRDRHFSHRPTQVYMNQP